MRFFMINMFHISRLVLYCMDVKEMHFHALNLSTVKTQVALLRIFFTGERISIVLGRFLLFRTVYSFMVVLRRFLC